MALFDDHTEIDITGPRRATWLVDCPSKTVLLLTTVALAVCCKNIRETQGAPHDSVAFYIRFFC